MARRAVTEARMGKNRKPGGGGAKPPVAPKPEVPALEIPKALADQAGAKDETPGQDPDAVTRQDLPVVDDAALDGQGAIVQPVAESAEPDAGLLNARQEFVDVLAARQGVVLSVAAATSLDQEAQEDVWFSGAEEGDKPPEAKSDKDEAEALPPLPDPIGQRDAEPPAKPVAQRSNRLLAAALLMIGIVVLVALGYLTTKLDLRFDEKKVAKTEISSTKPSAPKAKPPEPVPAIPRVADAPKPVIPSAPKSDPAPTPSTPKVMESEAAKAEAAKPAPTPVEEDVEEVEPAPKPVATAKAEKPKVEPAPKPRKVAEAPKSAKKAKAEPVPVTPKVIKAPKPAKTEAVKPALKPVAAAKANKSAAKPATKPAESMLDATPKVADAPKATQAEAPAARPEPQPARGDTPPIAERVVEEVKRGDDPPKVLVAVPKRRGRSTEDIRADVERHKRELEEAEARSLQRPK